MKKFHSLGAWPRLFGKIHKHSSLGFLFLLSYQTLWYVYFKESLSEMIALNTLKIMFDRKY